MKNIADMFGGKRRQVMKKVSKQTKERIAVMQLCIASLNATVQCLENINIDDEQFRDLKRHGCNGIELLACRLEDYVDKLQPTAKEVA